MYYSKLFKNIKYNNIFIKNIFKKYKILDKYKKNFKYFEDYYVRDGETPELISQKIYGRSDLYFIILLMNDVYNIYEEWVKSDTELNQYIENFNNYLIENLKNYMLLMKEEYDYLKENEELDINSLKNKYIILFKYKIFVNKTIENANIMIENIINYFYDNIEDEDYFNKTAEYIAKQFNKYIGEHFKKENEKKRKIKIFKKEYLPFLFEQIEKEKYL